MLTPPLLFCLLVLTKQKTPIAHLIPSIRSMLSKRVPKKQTILKRTSYKRSWKLEHTNQEQTLEDEFQDLHLGNGYP
ncbi:hypothetical protein Tco_0520877 [Tanacetum coccineum]